jgi:hypothetical protein
VLVLVAGLGTSIGFVAAQGTRPATASTAQKPDPDKPDTSTPAPTPADEKDFKARRVKLAGMLDNVDVQLKALGEADDPDLLRTRLQTQEQRLSELQTRVRNGPVVIPPELVEQLEAAQERVEEARHAAVPSDVLLAAVKLHPRLAEAQAKLAAKENEIRASKLPKDDAGRKKLADEREELWKQVQATQKQVTPEVEAYLRVPGQLSAQKAMAVIDRKVRQIEMAADVARLELKLAEEEVTQLRKQLAKLEPQVEEAAWLKEKRRRLKQELLELELREAGVGK